MTKYLCMFLILFTSMGALKAQYKIKSKPDNVSKKSVSIPLSEVASSDKIISISGKGYAIFEETLGDQKTYYLYNAGKQKKVKDLLTNSSNTKTGKVEFSDNDRYVITKKLNGTNKVLDIFDINNEESFIISSDLGNVMDASIHEKDKLIYEVSSENDRPKYFINNKESKSKLIAEGIAGKWAAILYTLLATAELKGLEPKFWFKELLGKIADHPMNRLEELLPASEDSPLFGGQTGRQDTEAA